MRRLGLHSTSSKSRFALLVIIIILAVQVGACNRRSNSSFHLASTSDPGTNNGTMPPANPAAAPVASYADIVSRVAPAVVTIHSTMRVREPQQYPFMNDPFFQQFFGGRGSQQTPIERQREALGSGVIVTQDGYILTN